MSRHRLFTVPVLIAFTALFAAKPHAQQIDARQLSSIVKVLASDEFEGRAPGGPGEAKTVAYLIERFTALGLVPGGEHGK
jgi:hypothetical protein